MKGSAVSRLLTAFAFVVLSLGPLLQVARAAEISITSPGVSILEGEDGVLWYDVQNLTNHDVTITAFGNTSVFFLGGDPTDVALLHGYDPASTCFVGAIIAGGQDCMLGLDLLTDNAPPENKDFGLSAYLIRIAVDNQAPVLGSGRVKVLDTPEPGTLSLIFLGVAGAVTAGRRRLAI